MCSSSLKSDADAHVRAAGARFTGGGAFEFAAMAACGFRKIRPGRGEPLSRIKKISGANLARNWVMIRTSRSSTTRISDLERCGASQENENRHQGHDAGVFSSRSRRGAAQFPDVNASIDGDNLVYKRYFNIGFAADTRTASSCPSSRNATRGRHADRAGADYRLKRGMASSGPPTAGRMLFDFRRSAASAAGVHADHQRARGCDSRRVEKVTKPIWDGKDFAPR